MKKLSFIKKDTNYLPASTFIFQTFVLYIFNSLLSYSNFSWNYIMLCIEQAYWHNTLFSFQIDLLLLKNHDVTY